MRKTKAFYLTKNFRKLAKRSRKLSESKAFRMQSFANLQKPFGCKTFGFAKFF